MIYTLCLVFKRPELPGPLTPWRFGRLSFLGSLFSCFIPAAMMRSGEEALLWPCEELCEYILATGSDLLRGDPRCPQVFRLQVFTGHLLFR